MRLQHSLPLTEMTRRVFVGFCAGVFAVAVTVAVADDSLDSIPESASVVIRAKSPEATIEKVVQFATKIDPMFGPVVQGNAGGLGVLLSNPTMAGVDQKQDWCIAVFAKAEGEPEIVFSIPATDAEAMTDALGDAFSTNVVGKRVLYSESEAAMKLIAERLAGKSKSISSAIDESSRKVFDSGDVAVFVNVRRLTTIYRAQLEEAEVKLEEGLNEARNAAADIPFGGIDMDSMYELIEKVVKAYLQAVRDTEGFTGAVQVTPDAVLWEEYARVSRDTKVDKFLQSHPTSEMTLLNHLPANQLALFGLHGDMKALMKWSGEYMAQLAGGTDENEDKIRKVKELFSEYAKLDLGQQVSAFSLGDLETGAIRATSLIEVSPMDKFRPLVREMTKAMSSMSFKQMGFQQQAVVSEAAEKYGKHSVDVVEIKQEYDGEQPFAEFQKKLMQSLYGPDGITTRVAYLDKIVVQTMGGGRTTMETALKAVESEATSPNKEWSKVRAQLAEKANLIVGIDLVSIVRKVAGMLARNEDIPVPIDGDALNEVEIARSYLGFSCTAEPQGFRIKGMLPVEQAQGGYKLGMFFFQQAMMPQEAP